MRISEEVFASLPEAMTKRARATRTKAQPEHLHMAGIPDAAKPGAKGQKGGMKAMQALGRMKPGELNKTEEAYRQHLELRRLAGEIAWYHFEPFALKLAPKTTYTPDFLVQLASGHLEVHEVKGFWQDDARVKIKVAASMFPVFKFIAVQKADKDDAQGDGWKLEEF